MLNLANDCTVYSVHHIHHWDAHMYVQFQPSAPPIRIRCEIKIAYKMCTFSCTNLRVTSNAFIIQMPQMQHQYVLVSVHEDKKLNKRPS